jgi:hypothetical protein
MSISINAWHDKKKIFSKHPSFSKTKNKKLGKQNL